MTNQRDPRRGFPSFFADPARAHSPAGPRGGADHGAPEDRASSPQGHGRGGQPETAPGAETIPGQAQPNGGAETAGVEETDKVGGELAAVERQRDEYLDMLRRMQADFENYKKRMMRQQTDLLDRAAEGLVERLLPALDALELAREHLAHSEDLSDDGKALLQASSLLFDSLSKEGLERVDDLGASFDPTTHEAVEHEAADHADHAAHTNARASTGSNGGQHENAEQSAAGGPVVSGVYRPGYRWRGRVIRPAMVRVKG